VMNLRASLLISSMLPVAVLMCFIAMRYFGVDANIVALSGIAIAIGTMVDMGIVLSENMLKHMDEADESEPLLEVIYRATSEVASAVITAVSTTIVSFLPVFTMVAAEGKLFRPLAFTKSFALISSIIVAIIILPPFAHLIFSFRPKKGMMKMVMNGLAIIAGIVLVFFSWLGWLLVVIGIVGLLVDFLERNDRWKVLGSWLQTLTYAFIVAWFLTRMWLPLGPEKSMVVNYLFVLLMVGGLIGLFYLVIYLYPRILRWCLNHKVLFLSIPMVLLLWGAFSWLGVKGIFGLTNEEIAENRFYSSLNEVFPGAGEEFMPSLDEGAFLLMPTSMPHAGMEENLEVVAQLDMAVQAIPEVQSVVGKLGRVESALDPAPISMYENIINYKSEYVTDEDGNRIRFKVIAEGEYVRDSVGELVPDVNGKYFRNWREHIHSPDDIWNEIAKIQLPGVTAAPKLQPIETRLVMLQTGMRAPMGVRVKGNDLDTIEAFGYRLEHYLKQVEGVKAQAVFADRIVGKPYLEIELNRREMARYGLSIQDLTMYIESAIGGMTNTTTVEGRERYAVRVRYARELRDDPAVIPDMLIPTKTGGQIPLGQVASINYVSGPQVIKSENTFLLGYVLFDKLDDFAEVDVVENAQRLLQEKIASGELRVPSGISYEFAGNYENQVRAQKRLSIVMPLALLIIFLILYFQFRSVLTTSMIFTSIAVAFSGGFIMIWLYGQPWFMDFSLFGTNLRSLFQMDVVNLSVAVWVGFIALFGIASDDGVVIATYLQQSFEQNSPTTIQGIRDAVVEGGSRRIRPCLMTTATTLLALLPILSSTGRGSDIMLPMAIPSVGGMAIELITLFIIPVLFSWRYEWQLKSKTK
jgi:Cu(I)/Ag(I) efflux system membrane protein CusA/SilA